MSQYVKWFFFILPPNSMHPNGHGGHGDGGHGHICIVDQRNVMQPNLSHSWIQWTTGHGHSGPRKQSISMVHYWVRHAKCTWSSCHCDGVGRVDMEGGGSTRSGLRLKVVKMVFSKYYLHSFFRWGKDSSFRLCNSCASDNVCCVNVTIYVTFYWCYRW